MKTVFRVEDGKIIERNVLLGDRCIEGRIFRPSPQHDDPYFQMEIGECPDWPGCGCQYDLPKESGERETAVIL